MTGKRQGLNMGRLSRRSKVRWLASLIASLFLLMGVVSPLALAATTTTQTDAAQPVRAGASAASAAPAGVSASQVGPNVEKLDLEIMPEYDDPRVLVIFRPTLDASVKLPTKVSFLIPGGSKTEINMACEVPANGGMQCKPTDVVDKGEWQEVSFTAQTERNLMFEFYYNPFKVATGKKSFNYQFIPTFGNIGQLHVAIQEPKKAQDFKIAPSASQTSRDDKEQLNYYLYSYGDVKKDQPLSWNVSYVKDDPATSVPPKNAGAAQTGGFDVKKFLPLVAVLALIGVVVYWMLPNLQRRRPATATAGARGAGPAKGTGKGKAVAKKQVKPAAGGAKSKQKIAFCYNCGTRIEKNAKFCTECGTALRA